MKIKFKGFDLDSMLTSPAFLWLISIIISVTMWVYVTGTDESAYITRKFTAPLEYRGLDSQAILRNRLSEVDIELRGPEPAMMRLDYNSIMAFVDARNLAPGKKYTLNVNVDLPVNISLMSCVPSQAVLDIVRQVTRLMTVETVLPADIPEGHYIEGVEIIPKEVGMRGAEDDVAKVGSVRITPSIEELQSGHELLMPVKFSQSEPFNGTVTLEPSQVRFRGRLASGLPRKRVGVNVRLSGKVHSDYEVSSIITEPSEIQIEGSTADLAKIEAVDTEVIDISGLDANKVIVAPLVKPETEGVSLVGTSSVRVSVELSEARSERMLANVPVELRGTSVPENWICAPSAVSVILEGRPSVIADTEALLPLVKAYADLTDIYMTPVILPVRGEVSSDSVRVVRVEPPNATLNMINNN